MAATAVSNNLAPSHSFSNTFAPRKSGIGAVNYPSGNRTGFAILPLQVASGTSLHPGVQCGLKVVRRQRLQGAGTRSVRNHWRILTSTQDEAASTNVEEVRDEHDNQGRNKEAWTQAVDKLAEEVQKLKGALYEDSGDKALLLLRETTEQLKEQVERARASLAIEQSANKALASWRETTDNLLAQAERAKAALAVSAQEAADNSKANLTLIAETAPDPIRGIAESALDAHFVDPGKELSGSKIHDFCLGIPYGGFLTAGGVFWFVASGSVSALRFGLFLGGLVLFLSISSLKVWRQGKSCLPYIQAQAIITLIILVREIRRFSSTRVIFPTAGVVVASAAMLGFYAYVYLAGGNPPPKISVKDEATAA